MVTVDVLEFTPDAPQAEDGCMPRPVHELGLQITLYWEPAAMIKFEPLKLYGIVVDCVHEEMDSICAKFVPSNVYFKVPPVGI